MVNKKNEEQNNNKGGRPRKYDEEELKKLLYKFVADKSPAKITYKMLVDYTNIPIQAWRFNENIKNEITAINKRIADIQFLTNTSDINELVTIPSAEDIVNTNYSNKNKLIKVFQDLLDVYEYAMNKSIAYDNLELENQKLKHTIKSLESDLEFYKHEIKKMTIDSIPGLGDQNDNVKKNVISMKDQSSLRKKHEDLFKD